MNYAKFVFFKIDYIYNLFVEIYICCILILQNKFEKDLTLSKMNSPGIKRLVCHLIHIIIKGMLIP